MNRVTTPLLSGLTTLGKHLENHDEEGIYIAREFLTEMGFDIRLSYMSDCIRVFIEDYEWFEVRDDYKTNIQLSKISFPEWVEDTTGWVTVDGLVYPCEIMLPSRMDMQKVWVRIPGGKYFTRAKGEIFWKEEDAVFSNTPTKSLSDDTRKKIIINHTISKMIEALGIDKVMGFLAEKVIATSHDIECGLDVLSECGFSDPDLRDLGYGKTIDTIEEAREWDLQRALEGEKDEERRERDAIENAVEADCQRFCAAYDAAQESEDE